MDMAIMQGMGGKGTGKISGCCGKLMCCLKYENDFYKQSLEKMPKIGEEIKTEKGKGKIISVDIIQNKLDVILEDNTRIEVKL
jgi:cell fate regulator YaaT (PSP1 superfamily)